MPDVLAFFNIIVSNTLRDSKTNTQVNVQVNTSRIIKIALSTLTFKYLFTPKVFICSMKELNSFMLLWE